MSELAITKKTKRRTSNTTTKKRSLFSKILRAVLIAALPFLGLLFQIFLARPYIIEDGIRANSPDPSTHEFAITNSGWTKAYNLSIVLVSPYIIFEDNTTIRPYKGEHVCFDTFPILRGMNIPPGKSLSFTFDNFAPFSKKHVHLRKKRGGIREAEITLEFRYNDFLQGFFHLPISYTEEVRYRTFPEWNGLIWKPVGPKYPKLKWKAEELRD